MKVIIHRTANQMTKEFCGVDDVIDIADDSASLELLQEDEMPSNYQVNPRSKTGY